jgi:hypothetical protein
MYRALLSLLVLVGAFWPGIAAAHFVWIVVESDSGGKPVARVCFSELPQADDADLLEKIKQTEVWCPAAAGETSRVGLEKQVQNGVGYWAGPIAEGAAASARCRYGVVSKRGTTFRLEYYAKYLNARFPGWEMLARDERLDLDIVPELRDNKCRLLVLYKGKPAVGSEIMAASAEGGQAVQTGEDGTVTMPLGAGRNAFRARWVTDEPGKEKNQEDQQVFHYATLVLSAPDSGATAGGDSDSAASIMRDARHARAAWTDFPGFAADVRVFAEGRLQTGRVTVAADGEVRLEGLKLSDEKAILQRLRSLVSHRMADGERSDAVSFAEEPTEHPLGRLIRFDEDVAMGSHYRIRDSVVREVNRKTPEGKFTISVFQVHRNAEGKYLPGVYSVNFWNADGTLRSSTTVRETWIRVGSFDLPQTHHAVIAAASRHENVLLEFANHRLLKGNEGK